MGGNCVKLNPANGSQPQMQNWREFGTANDKDMTEDAKFEAKAKAIAEMVYGNGWFEGDRGGKGHVGIVGNVVIKFNTKKKERDELDRMKKLDASMKASEDKTSGNESKGFSPYQDMKESCNNLRRELLKMAEYACAGSDELNDILGALKIKVNGEIDADADLLERTTVADILKKMVAAHKKDKEQAKILTKKLWGGHTPTYGSSVSSFRKAVNLHNIDVNNTVTKEYDDLVKDAVRVSDGIDQTRDAVADRIKGKIDGWCTHVNGWLNRTRDFLIGLVPETAKDAKALEGLCKTLDEHCEKIKKILKEMKDLAAQPPKDGEYKPENFGGRDIRGRKIGYSRFTEVVSSGFDEINFQFDSMLRSANLKHKFSDGNFYPDFAQSLSGQKIPKAYKDIADDISMVCHTFRNAIDSFVGIEGRSAKEAGEKVGVRNWNEEFDRRVGNAANAFDKTLEGLVGSANGSNRTEMLKVIMNPPNEQQKNQQPGKLKALAQSLKDMWKATFVDGVDEHCQLHTSFNTGTNLVYRGSDHDDELQSAVDKINTMDDFTGFVKMLTLTHRLGGRGGIFDMASCDDKAIPAAFPRGLATTNTKNLFYSIKKGEEKGKMTLTAMRYFNRLYDVANTFEVIDEKGSNIISKNEQKVAQ